MSSSSDASSLSSLKEEWSFVDADVDVTYEEEAVLILLEEDDEILLYLYHHHHHHQIRGCSRYIQWVVTMSSCSITTIAVNNKKHSRHLDSVATGLPV